MGEQSKEKMRNLEEDNENLKAQLMQCSTQLDSCLSKYNTSQQVIQELNNEVSRQKPQRGEKLEPCDELKSVPSSSPEQKCY